MATILSDRIRLPGERVSIYSGAFIQGAIAIVFAAYTGNFISKYHYHLTLVQYGFLFIPEIVAAVLATLFAGGIGRRCRAGSAYGAGLSCSLVAMALLISTEWAERLPVSYALLLVSTALVGAGLGLSFPFVRCYAISLSPLRARRQIILVNGLLSAGMAFAAVYGVATLGTSAWWSLPVLLMVLLIAEMLLSRRLRAPPDGAPPSRAERRMPARFSAYPVLALLYGACAIICISGSQHIYRHAPQASFPLIVLVEVGLWAALVSAFRVVFALIDGMESRQHTTSVGIFMIAVVLLVLSATLARYDLMHAGIYVLAAVGCAALLPIDTRPGNEYMAVFPLAVTVGLMALFPIGLGLSRYVYELFEDVGMTPFAIFVGAGAVGALASILLLPIILSWRTMAYFDIPASRSARPGNGHAPDAATPGSLSAPPPRRPHDHPHDGSGDREPGGATALPPRSEAGSRRQGQ